MAQRRLVDFLQVFQFDGDAFLDRGFLLDQPAALHRVTGKAEDAAGARLPPPADPLRLVPILDTLRERAKTLVELVAAGRFYFAAPAAYWMLWGEIGGQGFFTLFFDSWLQPTVISLQNYGIQSQELGAVIGGLLGVKDVANLHLAVGAVIAVLMLIYIFKSPDYRGNLMFNTLGNIAAHPHAGLLFIDYDSGDLLQLTGRAEIVWDATELQAFEGAQRLLRLEVEAGQWIRGALPLRWSAPQFAPQFAPQLAAGGRSQEVGA